MKLSLRQKILLMIVVVGGLFLLLQAVAIWMLGYQDRVREQGAVFQTEASHVARRMSLVLNGDVPRLESLVLVGGLADRVGELSADPVDRATVEDLEARWTSLLPAAPELRRILDNPVSVTLREFQRVNPLAVELLIADRDGRLIAASGKTTDYDQSDETWWQEAMQLSPGGAVVEGLEWDQSAGVFSLDIAIPVFGEKSAGPLGALKAVMDVSPMFQGLGEFGGHEGASCDLVSGSGRVLLSLLGDPDLPSDDVLPGEVTVHLRLGHSNWFFFRFPDGENRLLGYAEVPLLGVRGPDGNVSGSETYVVIHESANEVLAPLRYRAWALMVTGALIIVVSGLVGWFLVGRNFLRPLETLEDAAAALAATTGQVLHPFRRGQSGDPVEALEAVSRIKTGDEIEVFAGDFRAMADRLQRYQSDLRREIAEKTEVLQSDLDMAREFQQAFLPKKYPVVPSPEQSELITLGFQHAYQAAMSVSGDFFDIIKLSDSRAAVIIADVMGHGTRSALVTAILRTLLHGLARAASDPSFFLKTLNHHFYETMKQADQLIFVSATYLVLDTHEETVRFASAGHPSPLIGNRLTGQIEHLHEPLRENPALGLFAEVSYREMVRPLREEDVIVLYTDGIIEGLSDMDEEFGVDRLAKSLARHLKGELPDITQGLLADMLAFTGFQPPNDDLCLVAVEVLANGLGERKVSRKTVAKETALEM